MRAAIINASVIIVAACGDGGDGIVVGDLGAPCYPNETCNAALQCEEAVCVRGDAVDAAVDAPMTDALGCPPEDTEPNETVQTATALGIGTSSQGTLFDVHACPLGDKDTYEVSIAYANSSFEILLFSPRLHDVSGAILDANGAVLATTTQYSSMYLHAYASTPSAGSYYAQVISTNAPSSYELSFVITSPPP